MVRSERVAMVWRKGVIRRETGTGEPVTVSGVTVVPQSQAFAVRLPFGGVLWNRPVGVLIKRGAETRRMSITDVSATICRVLFGIGVLCVSIAIIRLIRERGARP